MINNKNKRLEITLTSEEMELLLSISTRFNITKTQAIKQAIKVFASKRKHYLTISYKAIEDDEITEGKKEAIKTEKKINQKELDEKWNKLFQEDTSK